MVHRGGHFLLHPSSHISIKQDPTFKTLKAKQTFSFIKKSTVAFSAKTKHHLTKHNAQEALYPERAKKKKKSFKFTMHIQFINQTNFPTTADPEMSSREEFQTLK